MNKEYDIIPLRYNYIIPNTNKLNNYGNWYPYYYKYRNNLIYWSLSTGFDTSNVTNMHHAFSSCSSLQSLDLSNFDTSNVTNMNYMFNGCSSLQSLDLSNFDTSKVTNMNYMFGYTKDNKISYIKCKQAFKDWCIANNDKINLKTNLDDITWDIVG